MGDASFGRRLSIRSCEGNETTSLGQKTIPVGGKSLLREAVPNVAGSAIAQIVLQYLGMAKIACQRNHGRGSSRGPEVLAKATPTLACKSRYPGSGEPGCLSRNGGEGGIRTPDTVTRMPHFECGAFNHSATSPTLITLRFPMGSDRQITP
jgi:hypothetical protein